MAACTEAILTAVNTYLSATIPAEIAKIETELSLSPGDIPALLELTTHDKENEQYPYGVIYEVDTTFAPYELAADIENATLAVFFKDARWDIALLNRILWAYRDAVVRILNTPAGATLGGGSYLITLSGGIPPITAKSDTGYKGFSQVKFDLKKL